MSNLKEDMESVCYHVVEEGFDYCFEDYSDWKNIKDKEFQKLKKAYIKAKKDLNDYIHEKA